MLAVSRDQGIFVDTCIGGAGSAPQGAVDVFEQQQQVQRIGGGALKLRNQMLVNAAGSLAFCV